MAYGLMGIYYYYGRYIDKNEVMKTILKNVK